MNNIINFHNDPMQMKKYYHFINKELQAYRY